jgi:DNA-directed RNA polymerase beta' subunit
MEVRHSVGYGYSFGALEDLIILLSESVLVSGIKGVKNTFIREVKETKEFIIETEGSNLKDVFCIPFVDKTRTFTNDHNEAFECLGIEATQKILNKEILGVLEQYGLKLPSH